MDNINFSICMEDDYFVDLIDLENKELTIVTSGGDIALYSLTKKLKKIITIDINKDQNDLFRKKLLQIKNQNIDEIYNAFGISKNDKNENSLLYCGLMHKNFARLGKILRFFLRYKHNSILKNQDMNEQKKMIQRFPFTLILNRFFFNNIIYKMLKWKLKLNGFYREIRDFDKFRLGLIEYLQNKPIGQNLFISYLILGKFTQNCMPRYLYVNNIEKIKSSNTEIETINDSITNIDNIGSEVVYLSNVPDLLSEEELRRFSERMSKSRNTKLIIYPSVHFRINLLDYGLFNFKRNSELEKQIDNSVNNFYPNSYYVFERSTEVLNAV